MAVISSSESGEERSWFERVVSNEVQCGVITGKSSMGMASLYVDLAVYYFLEVHKCES